MLFRSPLLVSSAFFAVLKHGRALLIHSHHVLEVVLEKGPKINALHDI